MEKRAILTIIFISTSGHGFLPLWTFTACLRLWVANWRWSPSSTLILCRRYDDHLFG
jgi:hypothetical protein